MPNCFQLLDKETNEAISFIEIDEKMCKHFGAKVDPVNYYIYWYDRIGLFLAMNSDTIQSDELYAKAKDVFTDDILDVYKWLRANYNSRSFYSPH